VAAAGALRSAIARATRHQCALKDGKPAPIVSRAVRRSPLARPCSAPWTCWRLRRVASLRDPPTSRKTTGVILNRQRHRAPRIPAGARIHYGIREFGMGANMVGTALPRRDSSGWFDLLCLQRLRTPRHTFGRDQRGQCALCLHARLGGVGQDGPTHEPVEHLMSLRAMPHLHVVRPSDANETLDLVEGYLSAKSPRQPRSLCRAKTCPSSVVMTRSRHARART